MNADTEIEFWSASLRIPRSQFHKKVIMTPYRGVGTYREKSRHGVASMYFNNRKLRDILCRSIDAVDVKLPT